MTKSFLHTLLCLALLLGAPAHGQSLNQHLKQAMALEAEGNLKEAIRLYQMLHESHPGRVDILFRLEAALSRTGKHQEAILLLEMHLKSSPRDQNARLRLADALMTLGRQEEAFQKYDAILESTSAKAFFALIAGRYRKHNLPAQAEAVYRRGRKIVKDPHLFAREIAELSESQARYPEAVQEYLIFVQKEPQYLGMIEARLRQLGQEGTEQERIFSLLSEEILTHPEDNTRLRLFTGYALAAGFAANALSVLTEHPANTAHRQASLLQVASYALDAKDFATSASAFQAVAQTTQARNVLPLALLGLARSREGQGHNTEAEHLYRELIREHDSRIQADEARYRLGLLLVTTNQNEAIETFQALLQSNNRSTWYNQAAFELADLYIQQNRFDKAESTYRIVGTQQNNPEDVAQAYQRIAECLFMAGKFEEARTQLETLLSGPAVRFALNDALDLSVLIQEGETSGPETLEAFAQAYTLQRQHRLEPALQAFQTFIQTYPNSGLLDRALAAVIELSDTRGQYPEAIQTCRKLITDIPWSPLCPWAHIQLARIYEERLGQYHDALRACETLLIEYPKSLEADLARNRLRALREKIEALENRNKETG